MSDLPNYTAGAWTIDTTHSEVGFTVRHMMVSKVRGRFDSFTGSIVSGEQLEDSSVTVDVELSSINTGNEQRDGHVRTADFFEVEKFPKMTFRSTSVARKGDDLEVTGDLTLKGVTKPVTLDVEFGGITKDAFGGTRAGFSASTSINRSEFGVDISMPMETGGVVIGEKITITLDVEAVLDVPAAPQQA